MGQPTHFTYIESEPGSDLQQGDILEPTNDIRNIFKEVHPHFLDNKYVAFLVLTQTCDLVRRNGESCKSRYVNLAAVRPLREVLVSLLDKLCERAKIGNEIAKGIYVEDSKNKAKQLLERIFNQNEQAMGIFYLHPDELLRIMRPSVALLQVSIAVRAEEHYPTLLEARTGRLKPEFQSKLGWLIGNLYSRVATEDFPEEEKKYWIGQFLNSSDGPQWVRADRIKEAERAKVSIADKPTGEIVAILEKHKPPTPKDVAIKQAISVIKEVIDGVSKDQLETIKRRLDSDLIFGSKCKK